MATILAPRLERLFLLAVTVTESALPRALFSMLYISPLMLELRTTFLAAEELASPLNMVSRSRARRTRFCWVGSAVGGGGEGGGCVKASNAGWWHWPRHCCHTQSSPMGMDGPPKHHEIQVAQPNGTIFSHPSGQRAAREGVQDPPLPRSRVTGWTHQPCPSTLWDPGSPCHPGATHRWAEGSVRHQPARLGSRRGP